MDINFFLPNVADIKLFRIFESKFKKMKTELDNHNQFLQVGDIVNWSGDFGSRPSEPARVISIELVDPAQDVKYGAEVDVVPWLIVDRYVVVTLDNGHWAYGRQIQPL